MKKGQKSTRDRMLWRDMFPMAKREKLHWTWKITHTRIRTFRGTSNIIVNIFKEITLTNEHDKVLSKEILFRVSMNYRVSMTIASARKVKRASNMSTGEIRKCHLGRECFADVIHSQKGENGVEYGWWKWFAVPEGKVTLCIRQITMESYFAVGSNCGSVNNRLQIRRVSFC